MNGLFGEQNITDYIPEMITGDELKDCMKCLPQYTTNIRNLCQAKK